MASTNHAERESAQSLNRDEDVEARPSKRVKLDTPSSSSNGVSISTPAIAATAADADTTTDPEFAREVRAGITEYICPSNLGFSGVLKQRYTDFLVNEIGLDGSVVRLGRLNAEQRGPKSGERKREAEQQKAVTLIIEEEVESESKAPEVVKEEVQQEKAKKKPVEAVEAVKAADLSSEDLTTLHSIFGESTTTQILALVRSIRRREDRKAKDFKAVIADPIRDKDTRTLAHRSLRRIFPNLLESSMEPDQSLRIKAVPPQERGGGKKGRGGKVVNSREGEPDRRRGQLGWEELGGEYLHFTLYKENKDTMEVVGFLGSKLGGGSRPFSFAGTKDRRACTVQRMCVKRQTAQRMQAFNKQLYNAAVGDFAYRKRDLSLGDLMGNEFTITLRDCHFQGEEGLALPQRLQLAKEIVAKAVADFSKRGFINYYGLQRFGSFAASTDSVGLKMLQGNLKGAVEDLLAYGDVALAAAKAEFDDDGEATSDPTVLVSQDDKTRARGLYLWHTTGKGPAALDVIPKKFTAERNIIQHLSSRNSRTGLHDRTADWQGALQCIPRNLRLMYVHAYQSLVWNVVAGKRWTLFGEKVVEGDLVLVHEHRDKEARSGTSPPPDTVDQDGEPIINPLMDMDVDTNDASAAASRGKPTSSSAMDDSPFERARPLSAAEAASGLYTIYDVVLPQPGFDVVYPPNELGAFYESFMRSEKGGGLDPHDMRRAWKEVSLSGGYRKVLARPLDKDGVRGEVRSYTRVDEQFVTTDLQRARGEVPAEAQAPAVQAGNGHHGGEDSNAGEGDKDEDMEKDGKLAVILTLQLGSSTYATVALRELMKAGGVRPYRPEFMGGR